MKRKLRRDILKRLVIAAMLAPPCTSFSIARCRTSVIRSAAEPWGIHSVSDPKDLKDLKVGNELAETCLEFMRLLFKSGIPFCVEHPASSFLWKTPEMREWMETDGICVVTLDQCQWRARWRKTTTLLFGHVAPEDVKNLISDATADTAGAHDTSGTI